MTREKTTSRGAMDLNGHETITTEDSAIASAVAFTEVARSLFLADSVGDTLVRAVDLCVVTIEACELAGALLFEGDATTDRVCTDPIVDEVDALQLRTGEGPCLDAVAHKLTFYADELGTDPRWPNFGPRWVSAACWRSPWPRMAHQEPLTFIPATPRPSGS